jgi:hypothetical protein
MGDVRNGSLADLAGGKIRVRVASDSGHRGGRDRCPLSAKTGREQVQQKISYSIASSAVASSKGGTLTPSAAEVFKLITRSNFSGRCIGKSLGLAPFRIFPT